MQHTGHYTISQQQSQAFAELSGDYNPLHVDAVYARRLQFGRPVIHGIHHLLSAWNAVDTSSLFPDNASNIWLSKLTASFPNPVRWGQMIEYRAELFPEQHAAVISAFCEDQKILALKLQFSEGYELPQYSLLPTCPPKLESLNLDFPPKGHSGQCQLHLDQSRAAKLFPGLMRYMPPQQLAQIIACTRIVGMQCPGLNSIFSGIQLHFSSDFSGDNKDAVHYSVAYSDKRVNMVNIAVDSAGMKGKLNTFFRPAPVQQPTYTEISSIITDSRFANQRALVIGGSRGIGETTAKLLCAGGADVIITYNQGREEAEKVAKEINAGNGHCQIAAFDVNTVSTQSLIVFKEQLLPTHIYYFASPHITANRATAWNQALFDYFARFYLEAFSSLVALYAEHTSPTSNPVTYFYPSSVFVEKPEKGFAEYAVAKGAGEVLCKQLSVKYPHFTFLAPRLPRMSTDQTSSIIPIKCESVLDVMRGELNNVK